MLAFRIFDDNGFAKKLMAVPEDEQGIDVEFLRREIRKSEKRAREEGNNEPVSLHLNVYSQSWMALSGFVEVRM